MAVVISKLNTAPSPFLSEDNTQRIHRIYFQVIASGTYAGVPGDPMDFTTLGDFTHSQYPPILVQMLSANPLGASGYVYSYTSGTTSANGKFQALKGNGTNQMQDIGAGAYPAGVSGDTIIGYADFIRL